MTTQQDQERLHRKRQGQTLAEFAITLPILLILMFGIIEFGRVFQAWVTLQNAARQAARYASTGQWDNTKYPMNLNLNSKTPSDPTSIVPCVNDPYGSMVAQPSQYNYSGGDQRGTATTYKGVNVFQGGLESTFATWNGGLNCDPFNATHQEMRRDMGRILSIIDQARVGAAGLAIEQNYLNAPSTPNTGSFSDQPWYAVWDIPQPRSTQRSWFNVVICSTRHFLDQRPSTSQPYYQGEGGRFVTYLGDRALIDPNNVGHSPPDIYAPGCYLNEVPVSDSPGGGVNNAGKPWSDPGGPADTVEVIISFNHPLITPLGLTNYIPIQARRTAIVEAFRAVDPRSALGSSNANCSGIPTSTYTPSFTPTASFTASPTNSATPKPSNTPAPPTEGPFTCSLITADSLVISGGQVFVSIHNQNAANTFLTRVVFKWPSIYQYNGMYMEEMDLDQAPHWKGHDTANPYPATNTTDTNTDTSTPNYFTDSQSELDRTIAGHSTGDWVATFGNGPTFMESVTTINDYAATFYLYDPLHTTTPCVIQTTIPTATPAPTLNPNRPTNTPTYTPDCASSLVSVNFIGFQPFGLVHLQVRNGRRAVAPLSDFVIQWIQRAPGILTLDRVDAVAPFGQPGNVEVWDSGDNAQDAQPPTSGHNDASDPTGTWVQNYNFPPADNNGPSITDLYLDFGGVTGLLSDIGVTPSDFNGTQFNIGCGTNGPSGPSGGGGNGGTIVLASAPTPTPTVTKGPTNTPAPTLTPSNTRPSPTPGPTKTPGPTATNVPATNTPPPTATKTPKPPPTQPGGGCVDKCG